MSWNSAAGAVGKGGYVTVVYWNSNESVKCPPGAVARHDVHGWVTVVGAEGWNRTIQTYQCGVGDGTVATARAIRRIVHTVDVRDLHPLPQLSP